MNRKRNIAMILYSLSHGCHKRQLIFLSKVFAGINRVVCACQIPPSAELSKSTFLLHNGLGVVVHEHATIGERVVICQNVTIGGGRGGNHPGGAPTIKSGCTIGAGAVLLGPIIIGENAKIGANAVVLNDIPASSTAVGSPAHIVVN